MININTLFLTHYAIVIGAVLGIFALAVALYVIFKYNIKVINPNKGKAIILRKVNNTYFKAKELKINLSKEDFTFNKATYKIDPEKALYIEKKPVFIYLENNSMPITLNAKDDTTAKELQLYVKSNVISQMIKGLNAQNNITLYNIMFMVIGLAMGILLGIILSGFLPIHIIPVTHQAVTTNKTTTPIIIPKTGG